MYSIVLMTALVTTTTSPNWCHRAWCNSYNSCSCYGGSTGHGYGAAGGCYGYHGGCYGGFGNQGGVANYGYDSYYNGCTGCYGCYGGHSCYGVPVPNQGAPIQGGLRPAPVTDPFPPINPKKDGPDAEEIAPLKEKKKGDKKLESKAPTTGTIQMRAKVRIELPEGGKLFVDGRHINVPAGTRVFQSPPLGAGEKYFYDIRIEVEQNGAIRREEQRVIVESGHEALVSFPNLRPGTNTARAR